MAVIALVACVKKKGTISAPAQDLYISPLFRKSRAYALAHSERWYILSAKYGLLEPETIIAPYEMTLKKMPKSLKDEWANRVLAKLVKLTSPSDTILFVAGKDYRQGLVPYLKQRGNQIEIPMENVSSFGEQLAWLNQHTST